MFDPIQSKEMKYSFSFRLAMFGCVTLKSIQKLLVHLIVK